MLCLSRRLHSTVPEITSRVPHWSALASRLSLSPALIIPIRPIRPAHHFRRQSTSTKSTAPHHGYTHSRHTLEASFTFALLSAVSLAIVGATFYHTQSRGVLVTLEDDLDLLLKEEKHVGHLSEDMAAEPAPGRLGNLTPAQEEKLRQLWAAVFRVCNTEVTTEDGEGADIEPTDSAGQAAGKDGKKSDTGKDKKKKRGLFRRSKKDGNTTDDSASVSSKTASTVNISAEDDKYGQGKLFEEALASMPPETIRNTIWTMVKHDHPDALLLRFLRARKWDVDKALVMLVSTMHWRAQDMKVEDIMKSGEGSAVALENGSDKQAKLSHEFLEQIRMGKSLLHGFDKGGRPICIVRVRLHHQGDQSEESMEQYTVYIIETARMLLRPPVDTAVSSCNSPANIASGVTNISDRPSFLT